MPKDQGRWLRLILHGKAAARPEVRTAVGQVREDGHRVDVRVTWEAGDSVRFAREAVEVGVETVVAGGGDGTLNEVVSGVVVDAAPGRTAVGLLPLGTANDFAHACGIPVDDATAALRLAAEAEPRPIDVGRVGERLFVNLATGGFGTRVTVETPPEMKRILGGVSYLLTGLRRFNDISASGGRLVGPDFEWEGSFWALAVGNGRQAGGGIVMCPDAKLDDGLLEVVVLREMSPAERSETLAALLKEGVRALEREAVVHHRAPWVEVSAPEGLYVNLDGEPIHQTEFRFEVRREWLPFHLPEASPLVG